MKKTYCLLVMIILITGCGNKMNMNYQNTNNPTNNIINDNTSKPKDNNIIIEKTPVQEELIEMVNNNTITKEENYSITYVKNGISKVVNPPNTSGYYSYYEAKEEGHKYLYIIINYKNLKSTSVMADDIGSISIKYANKYDYTGFPIIVDSDGDFTYASITSIEPLTTGKLYYLIDLPDEVVNSTESIVATFTTGNESYKINIR